MEFLGDLETRDIYEVPTSGREFIYRTYDNKFYAFEYKYVCEITGPYHYWVTTFPQSHYSIIISQKNGANTFSVSVENPFKGICWNDKYGIPNPQIEIKEMSVLKETINGVIQAIVRLSQTN